MINGAKDEWLLIEETVLKYTLRVFVINSRDGAIVSKLSAVWFAAATDFFVSNIDLGEVFTGVEANLLEASATDWPFATPALREESMPFCRAPPTSSPMTALDCGRASQA